MEWLKKKKKKEKEKEKNMDFQMVNGLAMWTNLACKIKVVISMEQQQTQWKILFSDFINDEGITSLTRFNPNGSSVFLLYSWTQYPCFFRKFI